MTTLDDHLAKAEEKLAQAGQAAELQEAWLALALASEYLRSVADELQAAVAAVKRHGTGQDIVNAQNKLEQ